MEKQRNRFSGLLSACAVILLLSATGPRLYAQADRQLYFLPIVPQLHNASPAHIPAYKLHIGIPFLSSVKTGFDNTLVYEDIFQRRGDSLYLDRDYLLGNLNDKNTVNLNLMEEYLSVGLQAGENYFSFRIADMATAHTTVTHELVNFLLYGNGSAQYLGQTANLGGSAVNLSWYREYAFGFARPVNDKFTAGIHLKYLQGIAGFYTNKLGVSLYTDPADFSVRMQSDVAINISAPGINNEDATAGDYLFNSSNSGFALDLGVQYQVNREISVSASLLNLGSITWKENLKNYRTTDPGKTFTFDGFALDELIRGNSLNNDRVNEILDSISDEIGIDEYSEKYRTSLPAVLDINGSYLLSNKDRIGLQLRNQFLEERTWFSATLGYTRLFSEKYNLMVSNLFSSGSVFNPGVGGAANIGPVQLYLICENIIAPFNLTSTRAFTLRFGINLVFGRQSKSAVKTTETE